MSNVKFGELVIIIAPSRVSEMDEQTRDELVRKEIDIPQGQTADSCVVEDLLVAVQDFVYGDLDNPGVTAENTTVFAGPDHVVVCTEDASAIPGLMDAAHYVATEFFGIYSVGIFIVPTAGTLTVDQTTSWVVR